MTTASVPTAPTGDPQLVAEIERALAAARIDFVRLDARRLEAFDPGGHSADQRLAALRALDTSLLLFNVKDDADAAAARAVGAQPEQSAAGRQPAAERSPQPPLHQH